MTIVYDSEGITVHHAEALTTLREMPDQSVHSIVCDPQYGLSNVSTQDTIAAVAAWVSGDRERVPIGKGFMGNEWDRFVPPPAIWDECYRVLTPGGHLLAFAGTRMADLAGLSIRLAGFEIRDSIDCIGHRLSWYYGQGFPKSTNVSRQLDLSMGIDPDLASPVTDEAKQWQGWGTALKPAHEPIIVARKPLDGRVIDTVYDYGTGALNIDGCRVESDGSHKRVYQPTNNGRSIYGVQTGFMPTNADGRWPTNVVLNHPPLFDQDTGEILGDACANGCVDGCTVSELDRQSGQLVPSKSYIRGSSADSDIYGIGDKQAGYIQIGYGDLGGASRFFPQFRWQAKAPNKERPSVDNIMHPTVKPLSLVRWLVKLVTPPNGTVLDWCTGSGTTGEAALIDGYRAIIMECEDKYIPLILQRLESPLYDEV